MGAIPSLGRALVAFGLALAGIGLLLSLSPRLPWLGRLPGDLHIRRDGFSLYVPLASCLVVSLLLSLLAWVIGRFRQ